MDEDRSRDLGGRSVDRRSFLIAAAGVAGSGLLAACGGGATPAPAPTSAGAGAAPTSAPAAGGATPAAAAGGATPAAAAASSAGKLAPVDTAKDFSGTDDPVVFNSWIYEINFVKENVARFEQQNKEKVNYEAVNSTDYPGVMDTKHINKAAMDMAYVLDTQYLRWYKAGWSLDYEQWWNVDVAKSEMYPNVRDLLTIDGKLVGLPYFTCDSGVVATNQVILDKMGIKREQWPKNWKALYDQLRQIKKDGGAEQPYLPKWYGGWFAIPLGIYEEMINQNQELVNDELQPVFDGKSEHVRIVEDGKKAWDDGLVPESILTMTESDQIDAFATGSYAYSIQQLYDLNIFNTPEKSKIAGHANFVPPGDHPWGHLQAGMYATANRGKEGERLSRSYRLSGWFGHKDNEGVHYVAKRWAIIRALNAGYGAVLEDPEVIAAYEKWAPETPKYIDDMKKSMEAVQPFKLVKTFWFQDWAVKANEVLPKILLGSVTPSDGMQQLRDESDKMIEKYKDLPV